MDFYQQSDIIFLIHSPIFTNIGKSRLDAAVKEGIRNEVVRGIPNREKPNRLLDSYKHFEVLSLI